MKSALNIDKRGGVIGIGFGFNLLLRKDTTIQHILMADDDIDHGVLFERVLKSEYPDIKLSFVYNGNDLLDFLRLNRVGLLFLDLNMPCRNGFECLQSIKENPVFEKLTTIICSSSAYISDIKKSFFLKADFYMVKPFITDHLKTALKMILGADWGDDASIRNHYFINNKCVPYIAAE
ncbi:MAG: response regulator [Flavisolibacter sp.]|nr:response regulator [Flavisolibacter sp.]